jgi:ribosomal protein S18 acetylase RimI-like enzyme
VPKVTVRKATMGDHPSLIALWREGDSLHYRAVPEVFAPPAEPARTRSFLADILADPTTTLLVAERADGVAGFVRITLRDRPPPFLRSRIAVVEEIVVGVDHHRSGIGKRLMTTAGEWAISQGATEIWLDVWEFNEGAISFYESLGFEHTIRRMRRRLNT